MNFNCALKSTHYLKKVSYRMLRKLHRLENRRSLEKCFKFDDEYCVVLYLRHMVEAIEKSYKQDILAEKIVRELNAMIRSLTERTRIELKIHRSLLVDCLHNHTQVFNWLKENEVKINVDSELSALWSMKCVPAYVGQFGNRI